MRRSLVVLLAGAAVLLMVGLGAGASEHQSVVTGQRETLANHAVEQARRLDAYFARSRAVIQLTAHNAVFADFYALHGTRRSRIRAGGPVVDGANAALAYLEQLYPASIGEACFIDRNGPENARVVRGKRAGADDLSPDESNNPFFAPTFGLRAEQVYQAKPYVSPDTGEWVISNSTTVPNRTGPIRAIVHFEVTIESFRREAAQDSTVPILVVDADTGAVVIDTRLQQRVDTPLGVPSDYRFTGLTAGWGQSGELRLDGRQVAYRRIAATSGNANHWYAVAIAPAPVGPLSGVSPPVIGLVVVALLLICYVALGLRSGHLLLVSAANTDALTGLHNRRRLIVDLRNALAKASTDSPQLLILCDLNGFKSYNDTYGHPAGDALLARLGGALHRATAGHGRAYRIGGDEFCVLAEVGPDGPEATIAAATAALTEQGDGFHITASHGSILLPAEATDPGQALQVADRRMYERKRNSRMSAALQTRKALQRALHERDPDLADRLDRVADLAERVCEELDVSEPEREQIRQAAHLHDIGKMAIPDGLLDKVGPLDHAEWAYVKHIPLIGERITAAAPALARVSSLIRSTRERFDGTGYPDQLAGDAIPLGARVIAACTAYVALTSDRPYAAACTHAEAVAELHRCAGTQLDPDVVGALVRTLANAGPARAEGGPCPVVPLRRYS